jgi:large subunit ribosomal protein L25
MDLITIEAKPREPGRKAAQAARRAKEVPCVLYGSEIDPQVFQVEELTLRPLLYTNEFRRVQLVLGKKKYECILKDVDWDPLTDRPMHADFQTLVEGHEVTLSVPIHYTGTARGVQDGGTPQVFIHEISVRCLPKDIPDHIAVDISELEIGDALLLSDLDLDFEKLTFNVPEDQALYAVIAPRELVEPEVEELEGEEFEEGEGEEGEEGAEAADEASEEEDE